MRRRSLLPAALILLLSSSAPIITACESGPTGPGEPPRVCCKVCKTGKACGDTCIARNKTCSKGAGCACNG
jgi:hypothetical protein